MKSMNEFYKALGPLATLYIESEILEIMIDAPDKVYVERQGEIIDSGVKFESERALRETIDAVLAIGDVELGPDQTSGNVRLPDGSRALGVIPPTAINGPYLVIRKLNPKRLTIEDLIGFGAITEEAYQFLKDAIAKRANILVGGGIASGKTTVANLLIDHFPENERVILVEPVYEMQTDHPRVVRLSADGSPDHSYIDLITVGARMRPDRLVFGEVFGGEAMHILEVIDRGHDGSLMTIHAKSPEDALTRLETMCLMANLGLSLLEIRYRIASALDLITIQQRLPDGSRKIIQIDEVQGLENDRYVLQPLFRLNEETNRLESTGVEPSWS